MITVIESGPLSAVQDPFGRPGWRRYGVPVGGAADRWSARLANRLVGNDDAAALIEVTLGGALFRFDDRSAIAVTGGLAASVGARRLSRSAAVRVPPGATLRLDPADGARGYVAVAGGIEVEAVLGSGSTDLRSGFGGHEGRALRSGDRLALGRPRGAPCIWIGPPRRPGPIRVVEGPHPELANALLAGAWTVGVEADRAGLRLDGSALPGGGEAPTMGLPLGAVEIPPDGRPIIMLADRPVTGGYRTPVVVIGADIGRVAQLRTGDELAFESVSIEEARAAWRLAEAELRSLERLDVREGELGWAGSHA